MNLLILVVEQSDGGVAGRSSGMSSSKTAVAAGPRRAYPYAMHGLGNEYDTISTKTKKDTKIGGGRNLSAWGIISIIMLVIFTGIGAYYGFYCYPFICSNERKYDIMNSSSTVTPTTSREFEKMDHYSFESTSSKSSNDV